MERSSLHKNHVVALVAIVIGYPVLVELFYTFRVFSFLWPEVIIGEALWHGEQAAFIRACKRSFQCEVAIAAYEFVPLLIVAGGVRSLFDGEPYASAVHPRILKSVHFIVCLVLVLGVSRYVVSPFFELLIDWDVSLSDEGLTSAVVVDYLAKFVAAYIATRHAIRIREYREEAPEPDADG